MPKRKAEIDNYGGTGIEVRFYPNWFQHAPQCPHGPMLLFERFVKGKQVSKRFYACSANRDRKDCQAFIWENDHLADDKVANQHLKKSQTDEIRLTFEEIEAAAPENRHYCYECQKFFITKSGMKSHIKHRTMKNITTNDLLQPSRYFLSAKQNDKVHAQYFLSQRSTSFLQQQLEKLGTTHVLCIGMPRLHEMIQVANLKNGPMKSLLMDIDDRYISFWPSDKFARFNMFNHYLFTQSGEKIFNKFVSDASQNQNQLAVVLDPPFGGLVDCIAESLKWIKEQHSSNSKHQTSKLLILWLFPYFMEPRIVDSLPDLHMLDYCVDYDNHKKFKNATSGRKMSPVRIFTNVQNSLVELPQDEGYRFCKECQRYVAQQNKHCSKCNTCPSKDGRTYFHCNECQKCVKPGRQHCSRCKRCELPDHKCATSHKTIGCHICGQVTHKRRDCPLQKKTNTDSAANETKSSLYINDAKKFQKFKL
uniref:Zinc finger CCHC domain-containing protein 4 n=1 Tax=Phallusia mammillata TaxID=59560 RepID=A0A6F9DXM8_9ASCI|nr:zinc finger CCHC domain-containing protein 4 [Phallusia mammillata]